ATFALNAGLWFRLGRLAIFAPSSRHAAGSGTENPPNSTVQISQATSDLVRWVFPGFTSGGRTASEKPPQPAHVVYHVGHRDRYFGTGQADGADDLPNAILLVS
ncbi:MAG: hypothetical protein MK130_07070, partial [Puniceicoccaceae bacterium]|nr:hypothetical protein [Puniceicoccaceae bacterium]